MVARTLVEDLPMVWNTDSTFGALSRALHWGGAILIFAMIALGIWAVKYPLETPEQMSAKWQLFALHKTIGVCAFGFGALRLVSMALQITPLPLAGHSPAEVFAARTVHWLLSFLMMLVPLAGWVRHASLPGFAPLYLPFGDSLPFVPADPQLSEIASYMHFGFIILLVAALALHISGALKHHLIDRDATLTRMLSGRSDQQSIRSAPAKMPGLIAALGLIGCVALTAFAMTPRL